MTHTTQVTSASAGSYDVSSTRCCSGKSESRMAMRAGNHCREHVRGPNSSCIILGLSSQQVLPGTAESHIRIFNCIFNVLITGSERLIIGRSLSLAVDGNNVESSETGTKSRSLTVLVSNKDTPSACYPATSFPSFPIPVLCRLGLVQDQGPS